MVNPPKRCPWCSSGSANVSHGEGSRLCDKDPAYVVSIIAGHFKQRQSAYVGIVWEAIGNGVLQALGWTAGGEVVIRPDGSVVTYSPKEVRSRPPREDARASASSFQTMRDPYKPAPLASEKMNP